MKAPTILQGLALLLASCSLTTSAAPRDLTPPWPEETLGIWGFNEALYPLRSGRTLVGIEGSQVAESWSGYSLVRDGLSPAAVAVPVVDPALQRRSFSSGTGMIRVWFKPDWASAGANGTGPGTHARLLELVALNGKDTETQWALYLNPEGNTLYLSGRGIGGATDFLKAEVNWIAGYWHLLALAYDEKQTTLFVDAVPVATGPAMPDVANWLRDSLALVIGSDVTGANQAGGEFEELCTFKEPQREEDLAFYFRGVWRVAMLGPVESDEREAQKARSVDKLLHKLGWMIEPEAGSEEQLAARIARPEGYPTNALWLNIESVSNGVVSVAIEGTQPDTLYELLSKEDLVTNAGWQTEGTWIGAPATNWTLATLAVGTRTNQLFLWAKSWVDADGNDIPDWWEQQNFGTNGVDGYADADNDGWVNLQEYQNGTSPASFDTPPAPDNFKATQNLAGTQVGVVWAGAIGPVQTYLVERSDPILSPSGDVLSWGAFNQIAQVNGAQRSYADTGAFVARNYASDYFHGENRGSVYRIHATYANGNSSSATTTINAPASGLQVEGKLIRNAAGQWVAVVSPIAADITKIRFHWNQVGSPMAVDVMATNFGNGLFVLPYAMVTNQLGCDLFIQGLGLNNLEGAISKIGRVGSDAPYFVDGRGHLSASLRALLKAASRHQPYNEYEQWDAIPIWWNNLALAGTSNWLGVSYLFPDLAFDGWTGSQIGLLRLDNLHPFWLEHELHNRHYDTNIFPFWPPGYGWQLDFAPIPSPVSLTNLSTQWVWISDLSSTNLAEWGVIENGQTFGMASGLQNVFGLNLEAAMALVVSGDWPYAAQVASAGSSITLSNGVADLVYVRAEAPQLSGVGYFFAPVVTYEMEPAKQAVQQMPPVPLTRATGNGFDRIPQAPPFSPTNTTGLVLGSVGQPITVGGWSKLAIVNGYSNKFAYLGQYFDKAYKANTNGTRSTNQTGILSPYGEFFATEPGKIFLTTLPDGISTNAGECVVHAIKLQLDVNHDGVMDAAITGPDNTSYDKPFVFWINNNFDRQHFDKEDNGYYLDDISSSAEFSGCPFTPRRSTPDREYRDATGARVIPSTRDLQDFVRFSIVGLDPALFGALGSGTSVTLSWDDVGDPDPSNPTIDLFTAASNAGTDDYLNNASTGAAQAGATHIARLGPGNSVNISDPQTIGGSPITNYVWCGVASGKGRLTLTIRDASSNVLARTYSWIELKDIKQMYERWTVGDDPNHALKTNAIPAVEEVATAFTFARNTDTNTPYILFVHGWNMERWEKDRFAETAFKRLYWQGYQGRFGSFRWPTDYGFDAGNLWKVVSDPKNYDNSENKAWRSAVALRAKLADLNAEYPSKVFLLAHSMGNVVAGEALRLAGTNRLVNTYIASQAAVPAHAYDASSTNLIDFTHKNPDYPLSLSTFGPDTPNIYGNWFAGNSGAAGRRVNFYNPNDYALSADAWCFNQALKPDIYLIGFYWYAGATNDPAPWNNFKFTPLGAQTLSLDIVNSLTDRYSTMAYAAESRSRALGATAGITNIVPVNLTRDVDPLWPPDTTGGNYNRHYWHSAQFRGNIWQQTGYWRVLLGEEGFNLR